MPHGSKCSVWVGGVRINFDSVVRMHPNIRHMLEQQLAASSSQPSGSRRSPCRVEAKPPSQLTGMRLFVPARQEWLLSEILIALTVLDDRLAAVLRSGDIRLVRSAWVLAQDPHSFRMLHRQALEALEKSGVSPSPLLSPQEAEELLRRGHRGVGVLSQYAR